MPVDHIDEYSPVIGAVDVAIGNNTSVTIVGRSHIDDSIIEFDFPEFNTDANFDADLLNVVEYPNDIRFSEMKQVIPETSKTSSSVGVKTIGTLITDCAFTSSGDSLNVSTNDPNHDSNITTDDKQKLPTATVDVKFHPESTFRVLLSRQNAK
ncbi:hypothetical protein JTB14_002792 [Gonioctena quinquepunctata]|nr:hypothetical protein JTB14_002792 [Gonioctena quinquepunctata]